MAKHTYPKINITTPVGRYISGDHLNKRTVDLDGRPIPADDQDYSFGLAIRKDDPGLPALFNQLYQHVVGFYGNNADVMARVQRGFVGSKQGGISWKIKDGDTPNAKGQPIAHGPGHWIFYFTTQYPVTAANAQNVQIDPREIKRGYWVDVAGSANVNGENGDRAGIFLNPNIIRLIGYAEEITAGLTAEQAFGNKPAPQLPPGASATPVAPAFPQPQAPGFPTQQPSPQFVQPTQQPYGAPPNMPQPQWQQPAPGFVAPPAAYPQTGTGMPSPMNAGGPAQPAMPYGAPPAQYPSSSQPGFPQPAGGFAPPAAPQQGFAPGAPPAVGTPPSSYPINPQTGQPIAPQQQFLYPPR